MKTLSLWNDYRNSVTWIRNNIGPQRSSEVEYEVSKHGTDDYTQEQPDIESHSHQHQHVTQGYMNKMQQGLYNVMHQVQLIAGQTQHKVELLNCNTSFNIVCQKL